MNEPLLTTVQAAHLLSLHPDTLRVWRKRSHGPAWIRVGNRYRYSREAIEAFLSAGKLRVAA
jgi:excisionase family DNA binding protein